VAPVGVLRDRDSVDVYFMCRAVYYRMVIDHRMICLTGRRHTIPGHGRNTRGVDVGNNPGQTESCAVFDSLSFARTFDDGTSLFVLRRDGSDRFSKRSFECLAARHRRSV